LDFNAISFGDFNANTGDIEGRLAVRNNVALGFGYSVGYTLSTVYGTDLPRPFSLVAGGAVMWQSGALYPDGTGNPFAGAQEDMFVGDSFSGASYLESLVVGQCTVPGCLNSYFDAVQSCYGGYQSALNQPDNVQSVYQWSGLYITCNDPDALVYYISINPSQFSSFTYTVAESCNSDAKWVINIGGTSDFTISGASFPASANAVVYNVLGSGRTITVENTQVQGSVFAPYNTLYQPSGDIYGRVVAADISMSLQINQNQCYAPPSVSY
jgi:choice-of-anchor A domain-containing protein